MRLIRKILVLIEMCIFGLGAITIGLVIFPILALFLDETKRRKHYADIIHWSWKFFIWIMKTTKILNIHINGNLDDIKGKIVVASHPSFIDIILLIGQMPDSLCLAKKELLKNPFMRNIVKSLYIINDIDTNTFTHNATEALKEGYNIIIFPTGTRTLPGEEIKIHKGAAQIAIASGINIVPIKIETDYPFLIKNSSPFNAGEKPVNYYIKVLPEIVTSNFDIATMGEIKARNHISEQIKKCIN